MAEKSLNGDMRQGPTMCACHLGFIQQNYKYMQEISNATIQSRSFAEKYLHITKKKHSKP
jgi:hypothetical protein